MTLADKLAALIEEWGPVIASAFTAAIRKIRSKVTLAAIVDRLQANDLDGAIEALQFERPAFIELEQALERAFSAGGTLTADNVPRLPSGSKIQFLFDVRRPDAEIWVRNHSSDLVTAIVEDQKEGIRTALEAGMARGNNPTQTALEIVGRVERATGRRTGGIIGLTAQQSGFVNNARAELLSGDPAQLRNYLTRARRDRRFDATIRKAIEAEKPLTKDAAEKIVGRYSDSLLKLRGDMIGRTESLTAINAADDFAFRQGLAKTNYTEADIIRTWHSAGDDRVRHTHRVLNGQKQPGLDVPFTSPSGAKMRFPGDTSLGAGGGETNGCRCRVSRTFDFFRGLQ